MKNAHTSRPTNTRDKGNAGEEYVCGRISERGFKIIERNVQQRFAEIDIVALDGDVLCFIEVRTRKDASLGHPAETVNAKKQRSIRRAAEAYLAKHNVPPRPIRFDVATILWNTMEYQYFENAF